MQTKTDISYGVIPLRKNNGQWEALVIHQYSRIGDNTYWVFPKGHAEAGETPQEAAVRELFEETGLTFSSLLLPESVRYGYTFRIEDTVIDKTVEFYVGIAAGQLSVESDEVREAEWLPLKQAEEKLSYPATREMFQEVQQKIAAL